MQEFYGAKKLPLSCMMFLFFIWHGWLWLWVCVCARSLYIWRSVVCLRERLVVVKIAKKARPTADAYAENNWYDPRPHDTIRKEKRIHSHLQVYDK